MTERKPRKIPPPPSWSSRHNCYVFKKKFIPITVQWPSTNAKGYEVIVSGHKCSEQFQNSSDGQIIGLLCAARMAKISLNNIEKELAKFDIERIKELEEKFESIKWSDR